MSIASQPLDVAGVADHVCDWEADPATLVALHVAATLLPVSASVTQRERVRATWEAHLQVVGEVAGHPEWALAYVPGVHHGDNDVYAVHRPTGTVFGGDECLARQRWRESTSDWLTRLSAGIAEARFA